MVSRLPHPLVDITIIRQGRVPNQPNISIPPNTSQTRPMHFPAPPGRASLTRVTTDHTPRPSSDQDACTFKLDTARFTSSPGLMYQIPNAEDGLAQPLHYQYQIEETDSQRLLGYLPPHLQGPSLSSIVAQRRSLSSGSADAWTAISRTLLHCLCRSSFRP